jgi:hypothetical protein
LAQFGMQITKSTNFRGTQQEFHNVYYYREPTALTVPAEGLIDEVVALEKAWHSTQVNFVRASVWSAGGTPTQNSMLFQKSLSGTGAAGTQSGMDRERAYLIRWPAGFDVRGIPVYLRKWYHTCGNFGSVVASSSAQFENTAEILSANRTSIANLVNALRTIGNAEDWDLCSSSERETTGPAECHRYLEHHQLGDMWR